MEVPYLIALDFRISGIQVDVSYILVTLMLHYYIYIHIYCKLVLSTGNLFKNMLFSVERDVLCLSAIPCTKINTKYIYII